MAVPSNTQADRKAEAVKRSKQKAAADAASPEAAAPDTGYSATATGVDPRSGSVGNGGGTASSGELRVTQVGKKPAVCGTRTKAGDLIEFRYGGGFSFGGRYPVYSQVIYTGHPAFANVAIVSSRFCSVSDFDFAGGSLLVLFWGACALYVGNSQGGSAGGTARG